MIDRIEIVIPGVPIVKKNTAKTSLYFKDKQGHIRPRENPVHWYSKAYNDWAKAAIIACQKFKMQNEGKIEFPVADKMNLRCLFYFDTDRVVDLSNLYEGVQDVLAGNAGVENVPNHIYQIITDDSVRHIGSHDGSRFLIDYQNPRTVAILTPFSY